MRFSKDGKFIATGCNKTTQVFNVETGELVAKLIDDNNSTEAATKASANGDASKNGENAESSKQQQLPPPLPQLPMVTCTSGLYVSLLTESC